MIKPSKKQLEFMEWEIGIFYHFGIRTFYPGHKDWDGRESELLPEGFKPENLNCEQWIFVAKQAGAKYTILTAKHHDGFALWPSKFTDYNISKTPWKYGKGDVVLEYVQACRKYGMKIGIYYSPADVSSKRKKMTDKEYDNVFVNQISELLSNYGKIDYLWFDGCGSENHEYDTKRIIRVIRSLQPEILIFDMWDPDTRWIGNEAGFAPLNNSYITDTVPFSIRTDTQHILKEKKFLPGECDVQMRPFTWFTSENNENTVKTLDQLMGLYDYSVGRGSNLLINIGPDSKGMLPKKDTRRILEFGDAIRKRFSNPIYEQTNAELDTNYEIVMELDYDELANCMVLEENLENGESITGFQVIAQPEFAYQPIVLCERYTMGHKAICTFPAVFSKHFMIKVKSDRRDCVKRIAIYYTKNNYFE